MSIKIVKTNVCEFLKHKHRLLQLLEFNIFNNHASLQLGFGNLMVFFSSNYNCNNCKQCNNFPSKGSKESKEVD